MSSPTTSDVVPIVVRRGVAADAAEFVRLRRLVFDAWPFQPDFEADPGWAARCAQAYRELIAGENFAAFVADAPGRSGALAACVTIGIERHIPSPGGAGRTAYVADMCTDAPFRGRGYGRMLLRAATSWAEEQGASGVHLYATEAGRGLYESEGFAEGGPFAHMTRWRR